MDTKTHENTCKLSTDHYGPCSENESEYYVADDKGKVLWRQIYLNNASYSDKVEWEKEAAIQREVRHACVEAAFKFGYLPYRRVHSNNIDGVEWPIEVSEIEERGDLVLKLPMGNFRLAAKRAKKGETTSAVVITPFAVGTGCIATDDTDSPPVKIYGGVNKPSWNETAYTFQASSIEYADGSKSGFLGCYVKKIEKIN